MKAEGRRHVAKTRFAALLAFSLGACAEQSEEREVGAQEHAIIEGELAETVPWAVQVYDVRADGNDYYQCTGSLVAPRWVLTAQHCIADEGETTTIRIGSNAYREGRVIQVDRVRVKHAELDMALLHLVAPAGTELVPLASEVPLDTPVPATIYGWGSEGTPRVMAPLLKKANISITGRLTRADLGPHLLVSRGVTGAGFDGDSGGPVMVDGRQAGIIVESRTEPTPTAQRENRHTNLVPQLPWLTPIIAEDELAPRSTDRVTLHDLSNLQGIEQAFGVGRYLLSELSEIGDNRASALRVPAGLKVTAYQHDNFEGEFHTYTEDTNLIAAGFSDTISSIVVEPR